LSIKKKLVPIQHDFLNSPRPSFQIRLLHRIKEGVGGVKKGMLNSNKIIITHFYQKSFFDKSYGQWKRRSKSDPRKRWFFFSIDLFSWDLLKNLKS